jgi:hypothetical protein
MLVPCLDFKLIPRDCTRNTMYLISFEVVLYIDDITVHVNIL